MKRQTLATLMGIGWAACGAGVLTQERPSDPPPSASREVTLKGNVLSNVHLGEKGKSVFLLAYDGTPEVRAELERILAEYYPERGLDADAAARLQDQFLSRLRYDIAPGAVADALAREAEWTVRRPMAVTGVVEEKDGKKWIAPRQAAGADFAFPGRMLAPDKPFVMPDREPLVLKISDALSLKCLWVPPGTFLMGEPYYQCPHWQEDPPHRVTLTRGFYLAEHPVTREMVEAVLGGGAAAGGEPRAPANVSCATMYEFCRILSQSSGRKVRVPTAAEWEYAARVGTSNPTFKEKYKDQDSSPAGAGRVKSKPPNAWGFYDMFSSGWERVSDGSGAIDRRDATDPQHISPEDQGLADRTRTRQHGHFGKGNAGFAISEVEYITSEPGPEKTYPGVIRFRVVVEAAATWRVESAADLAAEPLREAFSAARAAEFLDAGVHRQEEKCFTCHGTYTYLLVPPITPASVAAHRRARARLEEAVEKLPPEAGPVKSPDASHSAGAVLTAATLALDDAAGGNRLHPLTRKALDRMWDHQLGNGGWVWHLQDEPPSAVDPHFGATLAALAAGAAPEGYADTARARNGLETLREWLRRNPPATAHQRAMLLWASAHMKDLLDDAQQRETAGLLFDLQRPDGGWAMAGLGSGAWRRKDRTPQDTTTSDGYGTGFCVWVLRKAAGIPADDPRIAKAVAWLKTHQRASGCWYARSPRDNDAVSSYVATAYALMALQACGEIQDAPK